MIFLTFPLKFKVHEVAGVSYFMKLLPMLAALDSDVGAARCP